MKKNKIYTCRKKNTISLAKESLRNILHFSFFILHFSFLISCIYDEVNTGNEPEGEETEVTISIAIPDQQTKATRALTSADEDHISTVELLVYDTAGNFQYITHGQDITDEGSTNLKSFQVILRTGNSDITLLANTRDIIQQLYPNGIPVGTPKAQIEQNIQLTLTGKWETNPTATTYRHIPMWGEVGQVSITLSTDKLKNGAYIELHRMLATINITTSLTDPSIFSLTSVRVYNTHTQGTVIPADKNTFTTVPTIPTGSQPVKGPLIYESTAITPDPTGQNACIGQIYLFEATKGNGKITHPDHPCIVVGGEYNGKEKYYRIDIQSGQTYLDILRNHRYQIIITSVDDQGFNTPDEAYEAFPVGIEATVIDWTNQQNQETTIGGKYILTVSTDQLTFNPEAGTQILYIYTDHPDGWKFVEDNFTPTENWISFNVVKGNPGQLTEVKVTVTAQPSDNDPTRIYEVPIIVDNVEKTIRFAQLGSSEADLEIFANPAQIILRKNTTYPIEIQVSTYPFNMPLYFSYSGDPIDWETNGYPTDGQTSHTVQLTPKTVQAHDQLSGILTIYIQDNYGHIASTQVQLSWIDKIIGFEAILQNPYPYQPGTRNFTAITTVPWQVGTISQPSEWTAKFTGQQNASPSPGTTYSFDLAGNPTFADRAIEVEVTQPETSEATTITFIQEATPPVLSAPDGTQTLNVTLPSEGGKKVNVQFLSNVPWRLNSTLTTISGTTLQTNYQSTYLHAVDYPVSAPIWTPETVTLEFETIEYPYSTTTPNVGSVVTLSRTFRNIPHDKTLTLNLARTAPTRFQMATSSASVWSSVENQYNTAYYGVTNTYNSGWSRLFPAGASYIGLQVGTNSPITIWSSLDVTNKVTYSRTAAYGTVNLRSYAPLLIPENTTGSNRSFTIYVQTSDGQIFEFPSEQHGENLSFKYEVECESGWVPIDTYLSTHNNTFPTGGLRVSTTVSGFSEGAYLSMIADGILQDYHTAMAKHRVTNSNPVIQAVRPNPGESGQNRTAGLTYTNSHSSVNPGTTSTARQSESYYVRTPVKTFMQDHKSHKLTSTGRVIARNSLYDPKGGTDFYELYTTTWETAAGVDGYATTTLTNHTGYTPRPDFNNSASCASYSEWDDGGATWRLPTVAELQEMYNRRFEIGGFCGSDTVDINYYYWAIENDGSYASTVEFFNGTVSNRYAKTSPARVRCVRAQ